MKSQKIVVFILLLALLLAACDRLGQKATPTTQGGASRPVVLYVGWPGYPDTFNPCYGALTESYIVYELVYEALYDLNLDGTYSLELAEDARVSADGRVWTFHLKKGAVFHDGQPVTADDVVFSFNYYKEHEDFPYMNVYTTFFESVVALDERTVVLTFSEPIPNVESQLFFLYILPEHIWSAYLGEKAKDFENLEMIGSGPFRLLEYQYGRSIRLGAVKDHYRTPPKIDEVVFRTYPDSDAVVEALKAGEVDMITEFPNERFAELQAEPNIAVVAAPSVTPELVDIIFNQIAPENCPVEEGGVCSGHPALRDRQVRLALAHATDKEKLITDLEFGVAEPGLTLIPSGLGPWFNPNLQDYPYDVALANQILDEAGYLDADGDGLREMPDGSRPLQFRVHWPSDSVLLPRLAQALRPMWAQVGVELQLQELHPDRMVAVCCPTFDYDILLWGWGSDPDPGFLLSVHTTDEIPTGNNETGYSNPEFDELYRQQATELDPLKRQQIVWQMQEILLRDVVYIVPFYEVSVEAYRTDRFTGWITNAPTLALEDPSSLTIIEPVR